MKEDNVTIHSAARLFLNIFVARRFTDLIGAGGRCVEQGWNCKSESPRYI